MLQQRGVVPPAKRKLIYTGIDVPSVDTRGPGVLGVEDLANQIARLKSLPFDGVGVYLRDQRFPMWPQTVVGNNLFSGFRYEQKDLARCVDGLRLLKKAPNLTDNFLPIATSFWFESGEKNKFDWFDQKRWDTTRHNLQVYAQAAEASGTIKGFTLDSEWYKGTKPDGSPDWAYNIFSMNHLYNLVNKAGFAPNPQIAYKEIIRKRGREFWQVFEETFPGAPIIVYLGNAGSLDPTDPYKSDLWPLFLDGIFEQMEAMRSKSYVIDGYEEAYKYRTPAQYAEARKYIRERLRQTSTVPKLYDKYLRVGFGKWLDASPSGGASAWSAPNANFYKPGDWQASLDAALRATDEYVWIWSGGQARVLPMSEGRGVSVGGDYYQATWRARKAVGT